MQYACLIDDSLLLPEVAGEHNLQIQKRGSKHSIVHLRNSKLWAQQHDSAQSSSRKYLNLHQKYFLRIALHLCEEITQTISFIEISIEAGMLLGGKHEAGGRN